MGKITCNEIAYFVTAETPTFCPYEQRTFAKDFVVMESLFTVIVGITALPPYGMSCIQAIQPLSWRRATADHHLQVVDG
jgi:hypothetical protein